MRKSIVCNWVIQSLEWSWLAVAIIGGVAHAQPTAIQPVQKAASARGDYAITQVGPHSRVWKKPSGQNVTEIATGMNYWNGTEWTPSDASFAVSPDGSSVVAEKIQDPTRISANINVQGAVTAITPNGVTLRSTPIAIELYDPVSGQSAVVATITNSTGTLVDPQHVVFNEAFAGGVFDASVVYSLPDTGSFHQDIVFTGFSPNFDPTLWGFAAASTNTLRIRIITEFYNPIQPQAQERQLYIEQNPNVRASMASPDVIDYTLDFGNYVFGPGRAYTSSTTTGVGDGATVSKDFVTTNGRSFLVESISYKALATALQSLPPPKLKPTAMNLGPCAKKTMLAAASMPQLRNVAKISREKVTSPRSLVVAAAMPRGVSVDYIATVDGTGPTVFTSDTTYFVAGNVYLSGSVTMESAIFKYPTGIGYLEVESSLILTTTNYSRAVFTAADDDSVGATLSTAIWSGYTGTPNGHNNYGSKALWLTTHQNVVLSYLRFCYMNLAVQINADTAGQTLTLSHSQLVDCREGIYVDGGNGSNTNSATLTFDLYNCLFANLTTPLEVGGIVLTGNAINCTVDSSTNLIDVDVGTTTTGTLKFTNSIFSTLTSKGTLGSVSLGGSFNGFYSSPTFGSSPISVTSDPYQTASAGNYYLNNNSGGGTLCQGAGTTSINSTLLNSFLTKTTRPPIAFPLGMQVSGVLTLLPQVPRYATGNPDLGYYYDVLDYTLAQVILTGGAVTVEPGTAIGTCNVYTNDPTLGPLWTKIGFYLEQGSSLISHGTPTSPITYTAATSVQEEPQTQFAQFQDELFADEGLQPANTMSFTAAFVPNDLNLLAPTLDFRFSNFYLPATDYHFFSGMDEWFAYEPSYDSSMYLSLRDCNLHSGRFNLGCPDGCPGSWAYYPLNQVYAPGAVSLFNNLFDRVAVNIEPTYYQDGDGKNCDMQVQAFNNLFRGGPWFHLEPFPATAGNWVFEDNLFDSVNIFQDVNGVGGAYPQPLDYDYNGYWPLSTAQLEAYLPLAPWSYWQPNLHNSAELSPTTTGDGFTDGASGNHEVILTAALPYQIGPLGNYYLPSSSPLYNAGSRSPANAGLAQYTTLANQTKELAKSQVNIGLHYVATASSTSILPFDTDGDGIPDYVEDANGNGVYDAGTETDWQNAQTLAGTLDSANTTYNNIDLSGDGLVGGIKSGFAVSPFDTQNPFSTAQIITGEEPDIVTFELPVNYNTLTSLGQLVLYVDSSAAILQDCEQATDGSGNSLLVWNTTFTGFQPAGSSPSLHIVQPYFTLNGQYGQGSQPDPTVLTAAGKPSLIDTGNILEFQQFYSGYDDSGATLYALLSQQNASYSIEIKSPTGTPITSIAGSTQTGEINEAWDLTDDQGNPYSGNSVEADFTVTPEGGAQQLHKVYLYYAPDRSDGNFTVAYTWDNVSQATGSMQDAIQWGVVDMLLTPTDASYWNPNPYQSTYNQYSYAGFPGVPGYLSTEVDVLPLLQNLQNPSTVNFYFDGHGSPTVLGDGDRQQVVIGCGQIRTMTGNSQFDPRKGGVPSSPFRFVFLNACDTADDNGWAHAFGILDAISSTQLSTKPSMAQAFLGWVGEPRAADSDADWNDIAMTLTVFFEAWQSGYNLQDCIALASNPQPYGPTGLTLNFPLGKPFTTYWGTGPHGAANNFTLKTYGYPWITRLGYEF